MINDHLSNDSIKQFIDEIKLNDSIRLEEFPEYRLYISQIEEFFDKKLGRGGGEEEERKAISKTMIQNYIKDGLLMPPEGKCYNRNHVILLNLIYNLKSILTIRDIKKLLSPILRAVDDENNTDKIEQLYNSYFELKELDFDEFPEELKKSMNAMEKRLDTKEISEEEWNKIPQLLLVLILVSQANTRKKLAERIIDSCFQIEE